MNNSATNKILLFYFEEKLSDHVKVELVKWGNSAEKNQKIFEGSENTRHKIALFQASKKRDSEEMLENIHCATERLNRSILTNIQKITTTLNLPLLPSTIYSALQNPNESPSINNQLFTITSPAEMKPENDFSNETKGCPDSKISLNFPVAFTIGQIKEFTPGEEAYFNVPKKNKHPFIVYTLEIITEAAGNKFKTSKYSINQTINFLKFRLLLTI